jgi:flagellin-like protein
VARGSAPVVAVVVLVAITVVGAGAVSAVLSVDPAAPAPTADFTVAVDAGADRIAVTHTGGDTIDPAAVSVTVRVAGDPLAHQPPVPFFAATGYHAGPTGPFNAASAGAWTAGETGAVELASTNAPAIDRGDRVTVTVATDRAVIATLETTARG